MSQAGTQTAAATSSKTLWAGRIISALPILFLFADAIGKLWRPLPAAVVEGTTKLGWSVTAIPAIGATLLVSVVLYAIPRTSVLGAILLTGYLGGAVATNARVGNPLFGYILTPVYVGVFVWGGLFFRDARVRALIPWKD
jgi:hypothetical protein